MPRAYARRVRRVARNPNMPAALWARLFDEPIPPETNPFTALDLEHTGTDRPPSVLGDMTLKEVWVENETEILKEWVTDQPGTRPSLWWLFSAPEPRRRVGGVGAPAHDVLALVPRFHFGMPVGWITEADMETWPRLRVRAKAYNQDNPPDFETELAYLIRHDALIPGELKRVQS